MKIETQPGSEVHARFENVEDAKILRAERENDSGELVIAEEQNEDVRANGGNTCITLEGRSGECKQNDDGCDKVCVLVEEDVPRIGFSFKEI